jgi:preprotein translocase subunit SecD
MRARMKPAEVQAIRMNAVGQGVETIRNRSTSSGARAADRAEGEDRIVIQLPGVRTSSARSSWWARPPSSSSSWSTKGRASRRRSREHPEDDEILYQRSTDLQTGRTTKTPLLLKKRAVLTGDTIKTAKVNFGSERGGGAYVSLSFNDRGRRSSTGSPPKT